MPVKSKSQWRFMKMLEHAPSEMINKPKGLSSKEAREFTKATKTPYSKLPEKVKKK